MIFLAICPPNSIEVHVKYHGHDTVESATKEITSIRELMIREEKVPYDVYVYEANVPLYGLTAYELDDVDMNFYEDRKKKMSIEDMQKTLSDAMSEVAVLAQEEKEKYGSIK